MAKILVMTDLHVTEPGVTIIGLDPVARLSKTLAHAARHHSDASHLILTGDLTHTGPRLEYQRVKETLHDLPWPVSERIGNTDNRAACREAFPQVPTDRTGYVKSFL